MFVVVTTELELVADKSPASAVAVVTTDVDAFVVQPDLSELVPVLAEEDFRRRSRAFLVLGLRERMLHVDAVPVGLRRQRQ